MDTTLPFEQIFLRTLEDGGPEQFVGVWDESSPSTQQRMLWKQQKRQSHTYVPPVTITESVSDMASYGRGTSDR